MKRAYVPGMAVLTAALSGFCGLICLVVCYGILEYHFGGDAVSSTIVTVACLLGLGAGAYVAGRCGKATLKTLALLGFASGLFAVLGSHLLDPAAAALVGVLKTLPEQAGQVRVAVVSGSLLLILPFSALIGGRLPLLFKCFDAVPARLIQGALALGASLGVLLTPLLYLYRFDLPAVLVMAGVLDIALALVLLLWSRRLTTAVISRDGTTGGAPSLLVSAMIFAVGIIMFVFGDSLLRALPIANPSSAWNFPLMLTLFLFAFALGSLLFARGGVTNRDALFYRSGWLLYGSGLAMFLGIWIASYLQANYYPVSFLPLLGGDYASLPWVLLFCGALIMPAPSLFGAIFPLLLEPHRANGAGRLLCSLFLGACCGLMLGRFAGFPVLGTRGLLTLAYLLACGSGTAVMAWIWRDRLRRGEARLSGALPAAGMLAAAVALACIMPSGIWLTYITGGPERNWEVREGASGIAQLWWEDEHADLRVNGEYMSRLPYHPRHVKQEIFLLAQPRREKVLVLGLGGAEIVRSLVEDAGVSSVDVIDPSRELPRILSQGRAAAMLNHALDSPKLRIISADPRVAVGLYETGAFDLVFDDLAFASWAGATAVRSETYFREIRRILKPEGVFLTGANYSGENRLAVLAGLLEFFETVKEHRHAEIVIAAAREPQYFDFRIIQLTEPRAEIFGLHYTASDALPAWFHNEFIPVTKEQLQGVEPIRDELPVHEYLAPAFKK